MVDYITETKNVQGMALDQQYEDHKELWILVSTHDKPDKLSLMHTVMHELDEHDIHTKTLPSDNSLPDPLQSLQAAENGEYSSLLDEELADSRAFRAMQKRYPKLRLESN